MRKKDFLVGFLVGGCVFAVPAAVMLVIFFL